MENFSCLLPNRRCWMFSKRPLIGFPSVKYFILLTGHENADLYICRHMYIAVLNAGQYCQQWKSIVLQHFYFNLFYIIINTMLANSWILITIHYCRIIPIHCVLRKLQQFRHASKNRKSKLYPDRQRYLNTYVIKFVNWNWNRSEITLLNILNCDRIFVTILNWEIICKRQTENSDVYKSVNL